MNRSCLPRLWSHYSASQKESRESYLIFFSNWLPFPLSKATTHCPTKMGGKYSIFSLETNYVIGFWPDHSISELRIVEIDLV